MKREHVISEEAFDVVRGGIEHSDLRYNEGEGSSKIADRIIIEHKCGKCVKM